MPTQPNGDRVTAAMSVAATIAFMAAAPPRFRRRFCATMDRLMDGEKDEEIRAELAQRWRRAKREAKRLRLR